MDPDLRDDLTVVGPGNVPCLNPRFEERVAELDGEGFTSKSKCLSKPDLVRWRDDKYPSLCVYEEETLC